MSPTGPRARLWPDGPVFPLAVSDHLQGEGQGALVHGVGGEALSALIGDDPEHLAEFPPER